MGILNDDMKRVVRQQRMGFIATVCPDGTPNLSPKGTTAVWGDDHLLFADLASPTTLANLRQNPALELNVVDVYERKGYRFKGTVSIVEKGEALFDEIREAYETGTRGVQRVQLPARCYVLLKVERALPVVSPAYVPGKTAQRHQGGMGAPLGRRAGAPDGGAEAGGVRQSPRISAPETAHANEVDLAEPRSPSLRQQGLLQQRSNSPVSRVF